MIRSFLIAVLFSSVTSWAATTGLPVGTYQGAVSDGLGTNRFYCMAEKVTLTVKDLGSDAYTINWVEEGRRDYDMASCQTTVKAALKPISGQPGHWTISFRDQNDLVFGSAVLEGSRLDISGESSLDISLDLRAELDFSPDSNQIDFSREFSLIGGSQLRAKGKLQRQ
jgi:hypothetical protein